MQGQCIVEGCDGDVAAIEDQWPGSIRVQAGAVVEAPEGRLARRCGADGAGTESCS